jgi:hypothetical protein
MKCLWWWLVEPVSRFLERDEREAVLGDLAESRQSGPRALLDVLDVVIRRQARLWMTWRPWLILFALILPVGMLLSILSRQTSDLSAIYLWMYANNWDAALTHNPGFWRLFAETAVSIFISYLTLACWSWTGGFVLGSLSRAMSTLNSLLLCLILFFGQVIGAPDYFAFFRDKAFGDLHLPDPNAAVFEVGFYRVVLPVIVQILIVAIPALWGFRLAAGMGKLRRLLSAGLWTAAITTMAVVVMPEVGLWFFMATRIFHANEPSWIWTGIMSGMKYLQPVQFWPIAFLIAHAITQRGLRRARA